MRARSRTWGYNGTSRSGVIRLAYRMLRESVLGPVQTDKDGGFVLVDKRILRCEMFNLLNTANYSIKGRPADLPSDIA